MRRAALIAAALAIAGCSGERTEIVLFIDKGDVQVPRDIDTLRIRLASDSAAQPFFDVPIVICGGATTTCKDLPLTATLIPGDKMPDDNVRLQLDATLQGTLRISDVANFKFTRGASLRLDLVLSEICLDNTQCAKAESSCDQFGNCYHPEPEPPGADLSVPLDLAPAPDLKGVDFAGVDFSCKPNCDPVGSYCGPDKNGCGTACTCNPFNVCAAGSCFPCGQDNQACCPAGQTRCMSSDHACSDPTGPGSCVTCVNQGATCSAGGAPCCDGSLCNGTTCVACGQGIGDQCCPGQVCNGSDLFCDGSNHCAPCGGNNQVCCNSTSSSPSCDPNLTCVTGAPGGGPGNHCTPCGDLNDPCCSGASCPASSSLACDNGTCHTCGQVRGQICCQFSQCFGAFLACDGTNHCQPCGQNLGDDCCPDGSCANGLQCNGAFMMSVWPNLGPPVGTCQNPPADMAMDMDMSMPDDMNCTPSCGLRNCGPDPGCPSQQCGFCSGNPCDGVTGMCCGSPGLPCCTGTPNFCNFGMCNFGNNMCQPPCVLMAGCGQPGQPCCGGGCCQSPLVCSGGTQCVPPG
ncbi:MAG TPA: hypothetical protein VFF06_09110 [Polyangia bacterium]|nr:hypothetical protein [Polyangia bacterium]